MADGNGDGSIKRSELEECLDGLVTARQTADASRLRLTIIEQRQGLQSLVDRNLDGRLSRRELTQIPNLLASIANADGNVSRQNAPPTTTLVLQQASAAASGSSQMPFNIGPPWFFHADTNQDGDLSAAEFLGTLDIFRQLDQNADGAIDVQEALIADATRTTPNESTP